MREPIFAVNGIVEDSTFANEATNDVRVPFLMGYKMRKHQKTNHYFRPVHEALRSRQVAKIHNSTSNPLIN